MGVSHATSGAVLGLVVAGYYPALVGGPEPSAGSVLTYAAVCAGAALLPDLDHPSSTATRRFEVFEWLSAYFVRPFSGLVFRLTKARRDTGKGTHRGFTHTILGAILLGLLLNWASARWGTPVLVGILFVCIALAIKGLDHLVPGPPSLVIAAMLTFGVEHFVPGGTAGTAGWLGTAVTLGMIIHMVGDAITEAGAPLLWPLPIRQRRWYPVGSPRPLRFRAGGKVETMFVAPVLTVAAMVLFALVVPGVAPFLLDLRDQVVSLVGLGTATG